MSSDQDNRAETPATADERGCCSSAAKEVVINNPVVQSDGIKVGGCCKSAGDNAFSVKADPGPEVKTKAAGCCAAPTTKPAGDGNGPGEKVGCCSEVTESPGSAPQKMDGRCFGVVERPESASKKTDGCCSSVDKPAPDPDVGSKTKLDDYCASKRTNGSVEHDNINPLPSQDKIDDCCSSKDRVVSSHKEVVPPCCEGITSNCCDDTCLDELAIRECEKDGCTGEAHETRPVAGLTRRKNMACDQHAKSIRQRWADKLATVGCLCRSLLAMNQKTCCTSNKQGATRTKLIAMRGSAESLRTKISCNRSVPSTIIPDSNTQIETSTGADTKACSSDKKASCSDKKTSCTDQTACCTDKTSIACCDKEVYLDEALIFSSVRTKKPKTSCCAEKAVTPLAVNVEDPERGVSATEHIVLGISGMTCTGCETKLKRTLGSLAISNLKTSLVLGRADFDLDPTIMSAKDVVLHLQRTTEFKCTEMTSHGSEIHVIPDCEMKTFLQQDWPVGVTSMEIAGKSTVRISYDAKVIGARHLLQELQPSAKLAPYSGDSSLLAGSKHVRNIGFMTILSAVLTIPVLVLAWAPLSPKRVIYGSVSLALASVVQIVIAGPFYPNALKALIFTRIVEMDLLIVLSTSAAYVFSVVSFVYILRGRPLSTGEFFETSTLLVTLIMVGRYVSALARQKAVESVAMRSLQDSKAILITEASDSEVEIDTRLLHYDDVFRVMPDTRIVTDGLVISGVSEVNEAMMTGESKPVAKSSGSTVVAGSVNGSGTLHVRATHLPGENTISAIADMVDEAKLSKPKLQDIADKVASYFVPVIVVLSIITFCIWIAIGIAVRRQSASESTVQAITYAITVLIVSCPCAIGLAVPMVVVIANGVAAERGVVFKSAHVVELGCKVTHVIFDKTGTLTTGEPTVVAQEYLLGNTETVRSQLFGVIAGIKHPVAVAVAAHLIGHGVIAAQVTKIKSVAGKGVEATVGEDTTIRAGNSRWLDVESHTQVQHLLDQGHTVFCVEIGGTLSAIFGLRDEPRPEAITVVKTLQERGIAVSVVSGDDEKAVATTASILGISSFRAKCSPSDKRDFLQSIAHHPTDSKKKSYTLFIGDGANDGPALAQATIGVHISPSSSTSDIASDAARAAADAVLLRPSLEGLLLLTDISKAAVKRIAFNFAWSFVYNLFAVLLAAGAFVDVKIPPEYAGLGELVSVVPVVVVAIALKWVKF